MFIYINFNTEVDFARWIHIKEGKKALCLNTKIFGLENYNYQSFGSEFVYSLPGTVFVQSLIWIRSVSTWIRI